MNALVPRSKQDVGPRRFDTISLTLNIRLYPPVGVCRMLGGNERVMVVPTISGRYKMLHDWVMGLVNLALY